MTEPEGERGELKNASLLGGGELSVEDWCQQFPRLPKEFIEGIVDSYDDAEVRHLVNACIGGRLKAAQVEEQL